MAKRVGVGAVVYVETVWAMEGLHGTTTAEATANDIRKTTADNYYGSRQIRTGVESHVRLRGCGA